MIYKDENFKIQTNLVDSSFENLTNGTWKIGLIKDNPGITNEENDRYYKSENIKIGETDENIRCFKNKVNVKLYDGTETHAHIIHWVKSMGWFCITYSKFWDQFD